MSNQSEPLKILITGGAGFIGANLANYLSSKGYEVVVVDNLSKNNSDSLNLGIKLYELDICEASLDNVFRENKFDMVFHFAAQTCVGTSQKMPLFDAKQNILGSLNLFELCKKYDVRRVFAMSTAAVYGAPSKLPVKETDTPSPISFYGVSKLAMENYLCQFDLDWIILRPANVYGKGQPSHGEAGVVAIFADKMKQGLPVEIFGDGSQTRDFVAVDDVVRVCEALIKSDISKKIINISTGKATSIINLFEVMKSYYGYNLNPVYLPERTGDIIHSVLDNSLCEELLGVAPKGEISLSNFN